MEYQSPGGASVNSRNRGVFAPKILIPLLVAGAVGIGAVGVMSLLARRGEAAISMIPADALMAMSFDNTPSPSQVPLFNEIKAAMDDSGLNNFIDDFLKNLDPQGNTLQKMRGHIRGSFAIGAWGDFQKKPDMIAAISLDDAAGAESLLSSYPQVRRRVSGGMRYYAPDDAPLVVMFYGDYALLASSIEAAQKAIGVAKGKERNLYEEASFKLARNSLPDDASLMLFINGAAIAKADDDTKQIYEAMGIHPQGWAAMGVTLRSEGIVINGYEPPADASDEIRTKLREIGPLAYGSLDRLPGNALGAAGISNPGAMIDLFLEATGSVKEIAKDVHEGLGEFERVTGTSVDKDWIPALRGELFFAMYAPLKGKSEPGIILSVDNSNGGTATTFIAKLMARINSGALDKEAKERIRFTSDKKGDMTVYVPNGKDKKGFVAVTGNQVILFSREDLLNASIEGGPALDETEGMKSFSANDGAQFRMQIDMEQLFDLITEAAEVPKDIDLRQILSRRELTMSAKWDDNGSTCEMLLPIDLPSLIRVIGREAGKAHKESAPDELKPGKVDIDFGS
jgi:hypothetical protein